jgi:hypothetical protein
VTLPEPSSDPVPPTGPTTELRPTPETSAVAPAPLFTGPAVGAAGGGEVAGIVWFDRNDNAALDGREWLLPAVPVTLTRVSTPGLLRVHATTTPYVKSAVTGPDGSYRFTGLPPGSYRVTAVLDEEGFGYTSDTDGLADWRVDVGVVEDKRAVADFAGLGKGRLTGQVLDTVERHPVASAGVRCTWAGFDDVFGTADDVDMTDVAGADGSYDWRGVPYGAFTCVGKDPVRGTLSAAASVRVVSAAAVHATLPLGLRRAAAASRSGDGRSGALPRTGASTDTAVPGALLLILLGAVAHRRGRRRTSAAPL